MKYVIEAPLVSGDGVRREQLLLENGRVSQRGDLGLKPDRLWDDQHLLFPGFGDVHVHLREGQEYKEDFVSGTEAALNGGVTFCCDMPNNPIPAVDAASLERKRSLLPQGPVHIELYAALGPGTQPFGAKRYKGFLAHSTGPLYFETLVEAKGVIARYAGCSITFHCEDPELLVQAEGQESHEKQRPAEAEIEAVRQVIQWVDEFGIKANIAHVSTAGALQLLLGRKDLTFEVTPHHLFFDWGNRSDFFRGPLLKMNPPLRAPQDRRALLEAFKAGKIPFLATDHAPHTLEEKLGDSPPSGVPHLDTYGSFVTWLLKEQGVSPQVIYRACCQGPAAFLDLPDRGHLAPGARADMVVLDLGTEHRVKAEDLATKCGWSPFEGVTFPGSVAAVMVAGELVRDSRTVPESSPLVSPH